MIITIVYYHYYYYYYYYYYYGHLFKIQSIAFHENRDFTSNSKEKGLFIH